jgi:hypothetical protein
MFADSKVRGAAEGPVRPSCRTNEDTLLDLFTSHYSNQLNVMKCSEQILKSNNNDFLLHTQAAPFTFISRLTTFDAFVQSPQANARVIL